MWRFTLTVLLVIAAVTSAEVLTVPSSTADGCRAFTRCSECVFDSSDGVLTTQLPCQWCITTGMCSAKNSTDANSCPDLRDDTVNPNCPDMSCKAAWTTNNIYICRGPTMAGLVFACILLLFNGLYFLWLKAIWQLPWKYANINTVVDGHVGISGGILFAPFSVSKQNSKLKDRGAPRSNDSTCPICKVAQASVLVPSETCFWCDVVRYGFAPLYIGLIGSILSVVLIFALPLKPWFSDWYYALLVAAPYFSYVVFFAYVYLCRVSIVGDSSQKSTMFFQLAWILRGRQLKTVFPDIEGRAAAPAAAPTPAATNNNNSTAADSSPPASSYDGEVVDKRAHTIELLNGESIEKEFRKALQVDIQPDEIILWHEKPHVDDIQADIRWMIHLFYVACAFGVWLMIASFINDTTVPLARIVDNGMLGVYGFLICVISSFALVVSFNGCNRMYVLTNKRLLVVARGLQGAHVSATELSKLEYAHVVSYSERTCGAIRCFSWETPGELRKMPPIATKAFVAISDLDTFLTELRRHAPSAMTKQNLLLVQRENTQHMRAVWRLHIFINMVSIAVMPIVVLYSQLVAAGFAFCLMLLVVLLNLSIVMRGLRWQQMTFVPYGLLQNWSWDLQEDGGHETFFSRILKNSQVHLNQPLRETVGKLTSLSV